jgi:LisH
MENNSSKICDSNGIEALLVDTIRKRLTENGEMNKIESEVRAMVLNDIRSGDKSPLIVSTSKNAKSPTQIANHLVLEYLEWMNFQYTKEMFAKESDVGNASSRNFLDSQIGDSKADFDKDLPLLMTLAMKITKK